MRDFNTITFFANLFVVLVAAVPVFYLLKRVWLQSAALISVGVYMIFLIAPRLLVFYISFWLIVIAFHLILSSLKDHWLRSSVFWISIIFMLSPLIAWKIFPVHFYNFFNLLTHHFLWTAAHPLGEWDATRDIIAPVGLSFASFRAIDLLIQTNIGTLERQPVINLLVYSFFPPIFIVGPMAEYREIFHSADTPKTFNVENLSEGLKTIVIGLFKVYVLAYPLSHSVQIFPFFDTNSTGTVWLELFIFTWYFYFNFAGFSDLAVGCSRLFGVSIKGNFNAPFLKPNIQLFWNNWHMSLTRFAQRNIFVPFGGYRKKTQFIAVVATMMVIALWHGLSIPMILFGLYHSSWLCFHRIYDNWRKKRNLLPLQGIFTGLKIAGTYLFVSISFPLLVLPLPVIIPYYSTLIGL